MEACGAGNRQRVDLRITRWSTFLDLHGDGKATVNDLVDELRAKVVDGYKEALTWLQVLAPDQVEEME